jgi:hypothetical protein
MTEKTLCSALNRRFFRGRPCGSRPISRKTIARWRDQGKITSDQASLAFAVRPLCWRHLSDLLDDLQPGTKARIIGEAYKDRYAFSSKGIEAMRAMNRAGLVRSPGCPRPPANRRCIATSKQRKARCKNWVLPGSRVCKIHGARGDPKLRTKIPTQVRTLQRLERWRAREERKRAGLLPAGVGFKPERPQRSLEDQFRQQPRPKLLKSPY